MNPKEIPDADLDTAFYTASDGFLSHAAADDANKAQAVAEGREEVACSISKPHNIAHILTKPDSEAQDAFMLEHREITARILKPR